jgi:hypothetical protein
MTSITYAQQRPKTSIREKLTGLEWTSLKGILAFGMFWNSIRETKI